MSSGPVEPMATPQGVATMYLEGITRDANGCNTPDLGGHERGGFAGIMLIEEPIMDLVDYASSHDFDDFEDLGGGSNLGLEREPGSLLDYLRAQYERLARSHFRSMPGLPLNMSSRCTIALSTSCFVS